MDCTAFADEAQADADTLQRLISAITDTALANRESGGLYRWEARYLRGDDQATLNGQMRTVQPPDSAAAHGTSAGAHLATALDAVVVDAERDRQHRRSPRQAARRPHSCVLAEVATAISTADVPDLPTGRRPTSRSAGDRRGSNPSKYEALLTESVRLFNRKGYRDTTMEEIASAVGMPTSGIYRYFSGKNDILAAIYRRAADRLSSEASSILGAVADPEEALTAVDRRLREEVVRPPGTRLRLLHRTGQHGARRPEDPAQPAEGDGRIVGAVGGRDPVGLDRRAGAVRRARRHGAGDRRGQAGALRQHRRVACRR